MRLWLQALTVLGLTPASAARLGVDVARARSEERLAKHIRERYSDGDEEPVEA